MFALRLSRPWLAACRFASTAQSQKKMANLSPQEIWTYLGQNSKEFIPAIDLANALFQLSKHQDSTPPNKLSELLTRIEGEATHLRPRDLSNVFLACRRLKVSDAKFWNLICTQARLHASTFNAQQISNTLNALAQHGHKDRELVTELLKRAVREAHDFTPQGISTTLSAMAKLDIREDATITALCEEIKKKLESFDGQSVACTLGALGKIDRKHLYAGAELKLCSVIESRTFNSLDLPQLIHALFKFDMRNRVLIARLVSQISPQVKAWDQQATHFR